MPVSDTQPRLSASRRWRRSRPRSAQLEGYLAGHRWNPLTTTALGGRILSGAQAIWFSRWPPQGFGVLTTTGRRTGTSRRRCVRAIRDGDRVYLVSLRGRHAAWMHNIRADARVQVRIHDGYFEGLARELEEPTDNEQARDVYCKTVNRFDRMEYRMHRSGRPTPVRIRELHEQWFSVGAPVVIEIRSQDGATG